MTSSPILNSADRPRGASSWVAALAILASLQACAVGPSYRKPTAQVPESFKEGAEWQRARANPEGALTSTWWLDYHDDQLSQLIDQALSSNQSIAASEAAYRLAQATVTASRAALFPTVSANVAANRSEGGVASAAATGIPPGVGNTVTADVAVSWEIDLWGRIRRQLESSKAAAQASDAQRAGQRLSIAATVAGDYFALRQADVDIDLLRQQQDIDSKLLAMATANYSQGAGSNDDVLVAQDILEGAIAALQATLTQREQLEHALAVLVNMAPAGFTVASSPQYAFLTPPVPLSLPSELLERRYDVVSAERNAAAANARIGVAEAAFYPTLDLAAEGGYEHNRFAHLFSLPNRFWTLGPTLAETIFDGGARTAAVREARATYDENVANYRQTVLTAFQSVEDSLSSCNHLRQQSQAFNSIYDRNRRLFASTQAQRQVGTASESSLLTQQLTLLTAEQNLKDTQALLTQGTVSLIKNLGGGWQWDKARQASNDSSTGGGRNASSVP
jgi:NodT family efflux transporter outer membrane factor (OMF) lipoprotein